MGFRLLLRHPQGIIWLVIWSNLFLSNSFRNSYIVLGVGEIKIKLGRLGTVCILRWQREKKLTRYRQIGSFFLCDDPSNFFILPASVSLWASRHQFWSTWMPHRLVSIFMIPISSQHFIPYIFSFISLLSYPVWCPQVLFSFDRYSNAIHGGKRRNKKTVCRFLMLIKRETPFSIQNTKHSTKKKYLNIYLTSIFLLFVGSNRAEYSSPFCVLCGWQLFLSVWILKWNPLCCLNYRVKFSENQTTYYIL